jgi:hypothetical protein
MRVSATRRRRSAKTGGPRSAGRTRDGRDQPEPLAHLEPTCEHRRDGEEELVDEILCEQRAEHGRSGLRQDAPVPALPQHADGCAQVDPVAVVDGDDVGQDVGELLRAPCRRQKDGALEHRMIRIERCATRNDGDRRLAELRKRVGRLRIDAGRAPHSLRRREHRSRADEDDVGGGAQQPHHELVRRTVIRHERV